MRRPVGDFRLEVVDDAVAEVLRRMSPAQRVAAALDAGRTLRLVVEGGVRSRHPDWDDARVAEEVARRMRSGAG